jgi:hypothetical protein
MGTFDERIAHLSREVGVGYLVAKCEVDQPYAQDQHETLTYRHNDGRARYLGGPLFENSFGLLEDLADRVLTPTGSDVRDGMIDVAEWMAKAVLLNAPKDTGRLSESGHPTVDDNGVVIYDRPPIAPRERD